MKKKQTAKDKNLALGLAYAAIGFLLFVAGKELGNGFILVAAIPFALLAAAFLATLRFEE